MYVRTHTDRGHALARIDQIPPVYTHKESAHRPYHLLTIIVKEWVSRLDSYVYMFPRARCSPQFPQHGINI